MDERIRVLGIAPYEGMKALMASLEQEYPQLDMTLLVGDMEQGVQIAKNNFHANYDVVISRGGTAKMLKKQLAIPLIEIENSMYDILCALKLAGMSGRIAMLSFSNITASAKKLYELLDCTVDIYTVEDAEEVEPTLRMIQSRNYNAILCDMIANAAARRLGMNSFLITSGIDSIRQAFDRAVLLCRSMERLRGENRFFRELIRGQIGQTVVLTEEGQLYYSSQDAPQPELLDMLRRELPESRSETERRVTRNLQGTLYSIRVKRIVSGSLSYAAFFFASHKTPITSNQMGVAFYSRAETESMFDDSVFGFTSLIGDYQKDLTRISQSRLPVVVSGEDGTGKEAIVSALFLRSSLQNNPFVSIKCSLLNDKSWTFLLEHHSSPLSGEDNTICFFDIDALSVERRNQLFAALSEGAACRRNRLIFTSVCQIGETVSDVGSEFINKLGCLSLQTPPLRELADRIPVLVNLTLNHLSLELPRQPLGAEPEALALLQEFQWPHNFSQFRRLIRELAVTAAGQLITAENVRQLLQKERHVGSFRPRAENSAAPLDLSRTMDEITRDVAFRVLEETGGNQTAAAKQLGISRTTLWRLMQK